MKDLTLVVMAAGMGSRFGGLKQVEPVGPNGEAILDYSVIDAKKAGFTKVVFVIKKAIEDEFKNLVGKRISKILPVEYVYQEVDCLPDGFSPNPERVKPWGTGHAVLCCKKVVNTAFAVINADDFYGASAFSEIAKALAENETDYCMVGFELANTVTENGTVSRGVCEIENGKLVNIVERTEIDKNCVYTDQNGDKVQLSEKTIVSMNMWGFSTDIFKYLEREFKLFLQKSGNELKSEFFLPYVVDDLLKCGEKQCNVRVAVDKWYGVTYKEDKEVVVNAVKQLIKSGVYEG